MPGWIWAVLVVFMLLMLVIGAAYAFLKAKKVLSDLSGLGKRLGRLQAGLSEPVETGRPEPPALTQPLADSADHYVQVHAELLTHKRLKQSRHIQTWRRWER